MRIGFFSPLPPQPTGVADYSAALLDALRPVADVAVNDPSAEMALYHLGNNSAHREIYARALARPGVAVLHDAVLNHFLLGSLAREDYIQEFCYNYGAWREGVAERLWANRARSATDPRYFAYPMLRRIAERSRGIIVHNPAAAAMVRAHASGARIFEVPHLHFGAQPDVVGVERLRLRLRGSRADRATCVFGVFGHLRESKRIGAILRAFRQVRSVVPATLLLAGDMVSSDLERAVRPLLEEPGIVRVGHMPEAEFSTHAAACDVCINLRYPAAGETSGVTVRLMRLGKPVIMTGGGEASQFPAAARVNIDSGPAEEAELAAVMMWLARSPEDARAIGLRAQAYILARHSPAEAASAYIEALSACYDRG